MIRPVAFASVFLLAGWFMTHQLDVADGRDIVARWCALAEQRLGYLTELFESGRWRRFHSERDFLENIHEAKTTVKTWRDLLSREASRNNTAIDVSWLGRNRAALPRGESWREPVDLLQLAEISAGPPLENSIIPPSDTAAVLDVISTPAAGKDTTGLTTEMATIAERYPLLHNAL